MSKITLLVVAIVVGLGLTVCSAPVVFWASDQWGRTIRFWWRAVALELHLWFVSPG